MIGRLRGVLADRGLGDIVVDVNGVGYEVSMPARDIAALPAVGEEVVVHTHLHVREDLMSLFGFATEETRDVFRMVIAAPGVGPKLGLAVLSTLSPDDLRKAVLTDDAGLLATVPGIGSRTAQKMILDLTSRLDASAETTSTAGGVPAVREALEGLGYTASEIREALEGLDPSIDVEDLLRAALKKMSRR